MNKYTKEQFLEYILEYTKYILKNGTVEIYKFKIVNTHTLIEELIHYLELSKNMSIFNNNIMKIIEELSLEISYDYITKSNNGYMKELLSPFGNYLKQILSNGKSNFSEKDKKELLIRLNSINNKYTNSYLTFLEVELKSLFVKIGNEEITGRTLSVFENLINSYITEILYKGISKRKLTDIIYCLDAEEIKKTGYKVYINNNFFKKVNKCLIGKNKINSYFKIRVNTICADSFISLLKTKENFSIYDEKIIIEEKDAYNIRDVSKINDFFKSKSSEEYKTIIFQYLGEGIDYVSQGNIIKSSIDKMVDFLKWEFPKGRFQLSPLYISLNKRSIKYHTSYLYLDHEGHRHNGDKDFLDKRLKLFKEISNGNIDENIEGKLFTMLKYYRLGLNSSTYEERFLNLWIGWEHIFANNLNDKTGWNNIQRYVPLILTINHINKNLWDLIKGELNINNQERRQTFFNFMRDNRIVQDNYQPSSNLYLVLQDEDLFNKLLVKLGNNLIGKGKLLKLRNDLYIEDNKKIGEKTVLFLDNYKNQLTFQLYRMNRIRNSIVHTGKNHFKFLEYTTMVLEKYYLSILENILEHFTLRNGFSFDDYFLRTEESYNNYIKYIKSNEFKSIDVKSRGKKLTEPKIIL